MFEKKSDLREQLARAVQELKACAANYHDIMDKSAHGIIIVDANGVIRFANLAAATIFGCRVEELLGEQYGLPITSDKAVELNVKSRDGKTVAVESWGVEIAWEGKPARFVAFHDVTERKQKEQELRRLYRAVMESPCMVVISDARGNVEYVNPKFTELTGYLPAEVVGRDHGTILPGNLSLEEAERIRESMARGEEWRGEFINRKKSGEDYWESASIAPVKDFEGTITDFITLKEDITARKNMEASLRDSEELFRATFEQAAVGIAHIAPDGRLLRINRRYCEIVGYPEAELEKLTFQQITHPDDLDESIKHFTSLRASKLRNFSLEKRYIRKDGSTVWVNLTVSMVSGPDGTPRYSVSVIEDITARKTAEKAVQESRNRAQAIISSALDAVVEMDENGTIFSWNPMAEEIFGWPAGEVRGKRPSETVIPERYREDHERGLKHFLATGEGKILNRRVELSAVHRDGREFPIELTVTPIRTESGYTFTAFVRDISERKRAEEKFKGLLESAPDAMIIVDDRGNIGIVNSQTEKLFGYERGELYGRQVEMLIPERFRARHAEQREDYFRNPHVRQLGTVEKLYGLHRDGREFPVDISLSPLATDEGVLVIAAVRDISERKRTEEALRSSEARYRALFRDNPVMIVTLDTAWTMLTANPTCAHQLGYALDELEGQSVLMLFHEDDRPAVAEQLQLCMAHPGQVHRWQLRKRRKDGEVIWVEELAQALDQDGALNLLVVCQDITERKRMEDELAKASRQNALILASAGEGILGLDMAGNHTFVNASAAVMLGYDASELAGKQSHTTWHYARPDGSPYPAAECPIYAAMRDGTVHSGEDIFWRKDGTGFPVEFASRPIVSDEGTTGAVLTFKDITERKRGEEALQKSEKKFSKIFHSAPAMIAITTLAEGKCVDINETCMRVLGYRREEIVGRTMLELGVWENRSDRDDMLRLVEKHGFARDLEIRFRSKDGKHFIGLFSAETIDIDHEPYLLSMVNDITERKRMEEEIERLNTDLAARAADLEAANRELEAFNYSVAHDLRKPLTVVNGYCQAVMEICGERLDEQCTGYLREAHDGTLRMNLLIDALLDFYRLARCEIKPQKLELSLMAEAVCAELRLTEPERRVTFTIAEGMTAWGDPALLQAVLENLLGNAWKYTGRKEEAIIEFGTAEIGGQPAWYVRDNGPGFDMAYAEKLFLPFQRLPGADEFRGHGIGLATVERVIRRHGGRVWAEGEPGKGAAFWFTLP